MKNCRPLFKKYPRQNEPQPAHLEIDEDGTIRADWNGEIGDAVPECVWHGRTIRIGISPHLTGSEVAQLIDDVRDDIREVLAVTEIVNHVRRPRDGMDDRFHDMMDRLTEFCDDAETREDPCYKDDCEYCQWSFFQ